MNFSTLKKIFSSMSKLPHCSYWKPDVEVLQWQLLHSTKDDLLEHAFTLNAL